MRHIILSTAGAFLIAAFASDASALTAKQVKKAMVSKHVTSWQATDYKDETIERIRRLNSASASLESHAAVHSFSSITDQPQNKRFRGGAMPEDDVTSGNFTNFARTDSQGTANLPSSLDWRSVDGTNFLPPVGYPQGDCGACVAFAAMSTLEAQLNVACNNPAPSFRLSRQHFFSCGGGQCGSGWRVSQAMSYLESSGIPDSDCMPYIAGGGQDIQCSAACEDANSRMIRNIQVSQPTTGFINVNAIKQGLLNGPLLTNMIYYEDLDNYRSGVYRHVTGNQKGSHAVMLVGWDNSQKAWIVRNSWGEDWGEGGYFRVAWDDQSLVGRYTWSFDVASALPEGVCNLPR